MSTSYKAIGGIGLFLDKEFMQRASMTPIELDVEILCKYIDCRYKAYSDVENNECYVIVVPGKNLLEIFNNAKSMIDKITAKNIRISMLDFKPVAEIFVY